MKHRIDKGIWCVSCDLRVVTCHSKTHTHGNYMSGLGVFSKFRIATVSSAFSVCPSVRPHGTTRFLPDGFSRNLLFEYFSKTVERIQVSLKSDNEYSVSP